MGESSIISDEVCVELFEKSIRRQFRSSMLAKIIDGYASSVGYIIEAVCTYFTGPLGLPSDIGTAAKVIGNLELMDSTQDSSKIRGMVIDELGKVNDDIGDPQVCKLVVSMRGNATLKKIYTHYLSALNLATSEALIKELSELHGPATIPQD